ncbi:hypothetical protein [Terriglobus saanensis]|uniref:Uncharacterized protein n=1 Tax=Terriglobus saanensis (strain ATCC BAA-1853 / DSM 23119 / SP1PR4) TaxID=401053 RepID=E8V050_TERSS|nr:hypothetical protein [Terriglobus saanensis]ADV82205.1 hypothetical protein AciPR4_1382 [Terriglobus saanensis SP1PR4]
MIVDDKLVRSGCGKSHNRRWLTAFFVLCTLALLTGKAAYADPDFNQVAGGTSSDSPALTFLNGVPVMMARANDASNAMWYSINRGSWIKVPSGTTLAAPALVTFQSNVIAVSAGTDGNYYSMVMSNASEAPSSWAFNATWTVVPGISGRARTNLRPAVAATTSNSIFIFATYNDETINFSSAHQINSNGSIDWGSFNVVPGGGFTTSSVSAAVSNGILVVFQTGTDHHLYVQSFSVGGDFWQNLWIDISFSLTQNLSFSTSVASIGSDEDLVGNFAVCGVDGNVLRIDCTSVTAFLDSDGKTFSYVLGTPSVLNVPGVPQIMHPPTVASDANNLIAIAATFSSPTNAQPSVWLSEVKSLSALVTPGQ